MTPVSQYSQTDKAHGRGTMLPGSPDPDAGAQANEALEKIYDECEAKSHEDLTLDDWRRGIDRMSRKPTC